MPFPGAFAAGASMHPPGYSAQQAAVRDMMRRALEEDQYSALGVRSRRWDYLFNLNQGFAISHHSLIFRLMKVNCRHRLIL